MSSLRTHLNATLTQREQPASSGEPVVLTTPMAAVLSLALSGTSKNPASSATPNGGKSPITNCSSLARQELKSQSHS
jgi:hypothetical protein